jgi:DNA-binding CsgD family transcriptional regulator
VETQGDFGVGREPDRAWISLLEGGWVVVGHLDDGSACTIVAERTRPRRRALCENALSRTELHVAALRARGAPIKVLASDFGCAQSSISQRLVRVRSKLRLRNEAELVGLFLSDDMRRAWNAAVLGAAPRPPGHEGATLVLTYAKPRWALPPSLSNSERRIALDLIAGCRPSAIARALGISPRTVANHVASIFRKVRVSSRIELFVALRQA